MKRFFPVFLSGLLSLPFISGCGEANASSSSPSISSLPPAVNKRISKQTYREKALGGLLGQFAGFLSGYEFVKDGPDPKVGMSQTWFSFLDGPYAGNYTHYYPGAYATGNNKYNRLRLDSETGLSQINSDDDYHVDILNQHILKEFGSTSYAIKEAWAHYTVGDWGGGMGAMNLISKYGALPPFTATLESGNPYGWCTEAYIENETLGMNAPGMGNLALSLNDKFASLSGYGDSLTWARFYAYLYSMAFFDDNVVSLLKKGSSLLPEGSHPRFFYDEAIRLYNLNPSDYKAAAEALAEERLPIYHEDNIMTDPNVNGGFAILSWLYGKNDYLETCKYSSIMGYDGDCTAAICTGLMGIISGYKAGVEGHDLLNEKLYHDGSGFYVNDTSTGYPPCVHGSDYPEKEKIDDIVTLFQTNMESLLLLNGGSIDGADYVIPYQEAEVNRSFLFDNFDLEKRTSESFSGKSASLNVIEESGSASTTVHSGYAALGVSAENNGEVSHTYGNLLPGKNYHLEVFLRSDDAINGSLYAKDQTKESSVSFSLTKTYLARHLYFTATSSSMEVGIRTSAGAYDLDDFLLEETKTDASFSFKSESFGSKTSKVSLSLNKPDNLKKGQEILLEIPYRYSGTSSFVTLKRNGVSFGGFYLSKTGTSINDGGDIALVPYVFENDSDNVVLDLGSLSGSFSSFSLVPSFVTLFH